MITRLYNLFFNFITFTNNSQPEIDLSIEYVAFQSEYVKSALIKMKKLNENTKTNSYNFAVSHDCQNSQKSCNHHNNVTNIINKTNIFYIQVWVKDENMRDEAQKLKLKQEV